MRWIENYAWFGRKASMCVVPYFLGLFAADNIPDYAALLAILVMAIFGWARDAEAANSYWARRTTPKP